MDSKLTVLSTKILTEIQKHELINNNFDVIEHNFISISNKNQELKNINNNLIFTSQNAVLSILESPDVSNLLSSLKEKPVFCVGLKTKALLEENGFEVLVYVDYAEDLAEIISLVYNDENFTFFSGNLRKDLLPKTLKNAKIKFNEIEVYQTTLTSQKITQQLDAILFFSPSGVESYLQNNKIKKEICFCIGETTAKALKEYAENIVVAEYPSVEAVIEEVINEFS